MIVRTWIASVVLAACLTGALRAQVVENAPPLPPPDAKSLTVQPDWKAPERDVVYWYESEYWFPPELWGTSYEVGINASDGNSNTFSLNAGADIKRESEWSIWTFDINYAQNKNDGVETQNQALLLSRYDRKLGDSPWTLFVGSTLEYNAFRDFDYRVRLNGGLGYEFFRNDLTRFAGRFGAGASREYGGPDDDWVGEAVFGLDFDRQLNAQQRVGLSVDYFPAWEDFADYRMLVDFGWEVVISEAGNLSFKLGLVDSYDATPGAGLEANDINYALVLLWKP